MSEQKNARLTTLVLGAGLGIECGFPDGPGLKERILGHLSEHDHELRDILKWFSADTVDEIAADHPRHAEQLRRIVTKILYSCEDEARLQQHQKPTTYGLMLRQIAKAKRRGEQIQILTFNYDRSLQFLLNQFNRTAPEDMRLDPQIITPIYGRLAPLDFEDQENRQRQMSHHRYGGRPELRSHRSTSPSSFWGGDDEPNEYQRQQRKRYEEQRRAETEDELFRASKIRFIGELEGPPTEEIVKTLEQSSRIFLLGMGYHRRNLEILGLDFTKQHPKKLIAGTGLNIKPEQIELIKNTFPAITRIEPYDALTFLRYKYDISLPDSYAEASPIEALTRM